MTEELFLEKMADILDAEDDITMDAVLADIFSMVSRSISCMLALGNCSSLSRLSSSIWISTSTKALPIPIILSIYLIFDCKDIVFS